MGAFVPGGDRAGLNFIARISFCRSALLVDAIGRFLVTHNDSAQLGVEIEHGFRVLPKKRLRSKIRGMIVRMAHMVFGRSVFDATPTLPFQLPSTRFGSTPFPPASVPI